MSVTLNSSGRFITIEGVEGSGKSTQIKKIKTFLEKRNIPFILSREPGGTRLSEAIRNLILLEKDDVPTPVSELLLIFAARAQHFEKKIKPALKNGKWVICDRFTDASYAYQGGGRGLDLSVISYLEEFVQGKIRPDLTIFLDLSIEHSRSRVATRNFSDRIERETDTFFERVRNTYLNRIKKFPDQYFVLDGNLEVDHLGFLIERKICKKFGVV